MAGKRITQIRCKVCAQKLLTRMMRIRCLRLACGLLVWGRSRLLRGGAFCEIKILLKEPVSPFIWETEAVTKKIE